MLKMLLFASLVSIPSLAATDPLQAFIGLKGGYQWVQDASYNYSNPDDTILGLYGGLQLNPSWRLDVGYQYHDELEAEATSINVKSQFFESAIRYDWYLQGSLSLYGRLGITYWDMEKTRMSSNRTEGVGFSPLGEVGINYYFAPNFQISAGYQYIDSVGNSNTGEYDSHGFLVSLTYKFGGEQQPTLVEFTPDPVIESISDTDAINVTKLHKMQVFPQKAIDELFDFDSIELSDQFIGQLTKVASILNEHPQALAVVVGFSDSTGSKLYNQKLSECRAKAVVNKLIELKVAPTQLKWKGEGESRPIAENNTPEGRAKNRRVKITIPSFQFQE